MSSNTEQVNDFVKQAALFIAEFKSLSVEDALSVVYNSETFRIIDENRAEGLTPQQLLEMFKNEVVTGKV